MNYFVAQVKTGGEEKYIVTANRALAHLEDPPRLIWPRRRLGLRKKGKTADQLAPIFPGYVFIETDSLSKEAYWALRRGIGFYTFLRNNHDVQALSEEDRDLLLHFLKLGEVVEKSTVYFDENNRIRVTQGALKDLEGRIVKVDKRKKRAKVKLSLYENSFLVDFGFEVMELVKRDESDEK